MASLSVGQTETMGSASCATADAQPNPPLWPSSVRVFKPSEAPEDITAEVKAKASRLLDRHTGHFSNERLAFLFEPGKAMIEATYLVYILLSGLHDLDTALLLLTNVRSSLCSGVYENVSINVGYYVEVLGLGCVVIAVCLRCMISVPKLCERLSSFHRGACL